MELDVIGKDGKSTGRKVTLSDSIFGKDVNDHLVYLNVKQYLANKRQGTHKSKERAEISGSTKKIKRQKGTGTARAGSIKSPVFVGGGRAFGPRVRDYSFKINKKSKLAARNSAYSEKAKEGKITVLEDFDLEAPKTKEFISLLKNLKVEEHKSLMLVAEKSPNLYLSSRNLPKSKVILAQDVNIYEVLHADNLIITEKSLELIQNK